MDIKTFEENVIKMAKMMWPGRSCYSSEQLNVIRAKLRSDKDLMEPPPPPAPKIDKKEVEETKLDLKKEVKFEPVAKKATRGRPKKK